MTPLSGLDNPRETFNLNYIMNLASGVRQMLKLCHGEFLCRSTDLAGVVTSQIDSVKGTVPLAAQFARA